MNKVVSHYSSKLYTWVVYTWGCLKASVLEDLKSQKKEIGIKFSAVSLE